MIAGKKQKAEQAASLFGSRARSDKNGLDQNHVTGSAENHAEKGVMPPGMEKNNDSAGDQFREPVGKREEIQVFQAENDQHGHGGIRENLSEIGNHSRRFPVAAENEKRQKAEQNRDRGGNCDSQDGVDGIDHQAISLPRMP